MSPRIDVAAAAICSPDHRVLIARRAANAHQGGLWEFPGGKIEAGETSFEALKRELDEELGIQPVKAEPLIRIRHDYTDKQVCLHVWKVSEFRGIPAGREGQPLRWVTLSELSLYPFPAANHPIVTSLLLPETLLITGSFEDQSDFSVRLDRALECGISLIQLRAKMLDKVQYRCLAMQTLEAVEGRAKVMLNCPIDWWPSMPGEHFHLSSEQLAQLSCRRANRPESAKGWLSTSCHTLSEIGLAAQVGVDFALISPVKKTATHPNAKPLGWSVFQSLCDQAPFPVFALGGVDRRDVGAAKKHGGQGVAGIRAFWNP